MVVSAQDRRRFERQVAALREAENDEEGSLAWRAAVHEWADARRLEMGLDDLATEPELHRRARALGLLRTFP